MKICTRLPLLVLAFALPASAAHAPLVIIKDFGGISALPYYQDLAADTNESQSSTPAPELGLHNGGAFPVRTPELTPGPVQGRAINAPGLQPMFLVGDDDTSRAWLQANRQQLQQLQAVGLAANVASAERLVAIRSWAPDLRITPTPAGDIAKRLGLRHYPVLITATTIQQ